jgi:adenosylcobinamide-GDP ribazoletransferase
MTGHNIDLMAKDDVPAAFGLLTRLPVRVDPEAASARGGRAAWAWPLVGVGLALLAGGAAQLVLWAGLDAVIAAGVALMVAVVLTGAMHEDGLADSIDGLWGGWDRDRRLEIMKDSRIGAYGVIALVLSLGFRWVAVAELIEADWLFAGLIAAGLLSRGAMALLMAALPAARSGGLSRAVGAPSVEAVLLAVAIGVVGSGIALGWAALPALAVAAALTLAWGSVARAKIGGQTGDILGGLQQIVEIGVLCAVLATL